MTDQNIGVKDAVGDSQPIAVQATTTEGETVYIQEFVLVDPITRDQISVSTEATLLALLAKQTELNLRFEYPNFTLDTTTTAGVVYFYQTNVNGSAETAATWKVGRYTQATATKEWADGDTNFDNVAANRALLTYA